MKEALRLARDILAELRGIREALDTIAAKNNTYPYFYTSPGTFGTTTTTLPYTVTLSNTGGGHNPPAA